MSAFHTVYCDYCIIYRENNKQQINWLNAKYTVQNDSFLSTEDKQINS